MQFVSGEDYRPRQQRPKRSQWPLGGVLAAAVVILVILAGGIFGAVDYERRQNQQNNSNPTTPPPASNASNGTGGTGVSNGTGANSGNSDGKRSTGGGSFKAAVTAVSAQSITVKLSDGTTKTYAITANTTISNSRTQSFGSPGSGQSDTNGIHAGDMVLVTPDPNNASQAIGILINPA
ncbi:MAG TPA: hypothetical protein VLF59_00750 [Candidatus Saccharimonadales bacterium]|nr:hypothetical protein [Candidatus Saccharimonadales bacterium]